MPQNSPSCTNNQRQEPHSFSNSHNYVMSPIQWRAGIYNGSLERFPYIATTNRIHHAPDNGTRHNGAIYQLHILLQLRRRNMQNLYRHTATALAAAIARWRHKTYMSRTRTLLPSDASCTKQQQHQHRTSNHYAR